ncbi:hypothetical protein L284_07320 [Novosphingobium lindaniclasticum LE124]|uniref:Uncharacterized protein n=1 Tax=Novosphingobium lindaniclasticum LE124 TaxID=1096930 RepID=T0J6N5_9SPHN|nr:hypothetical protein L284_07320 [Novosphingobium lindaniclasticum LE124]
MAFWSAVIEADVLGFACAPLGPVDVDGGMAGSSGTGGASLPTC